MLDLNSWFGSGLKLPSDSYSAMPTGLSNDGAAVGASASSSGVSMGTGGLAMGIGGAVSSMIGAWSSASLAKSALETQSQIAAINAHISELGAQSALLSGQRQEQASMLRTAQLKSTQRASMAANGLDLGSGTPLNVLTSTDVMGKIDVNTIHANALQTAWGYRTQGLNAMTSAAANSATASAISPGLSATTSLLGSASSVAANWYRFRGF